MTDTAFPPAPWRLVGDMYASVWRPSPADLPAWPLPPGARLLVLRRRATLVTLWVDYRPGGVLTYRELLVALAVTHRRRVAATAVAAWVDDPRSLAGGRALWGIPKQLASFGFSRGSGPVPVVTTMTDAGGADTEAVFVPRRRLPGRIPVRSHLVQQAGAATVRVPLRLSGSVALCRSRLTACSDGPLGFLHGHRPVTSVAVEDFRFTVDSAR